MSAATQGRTPLSLSFVDEQTFQLALQPQDLAETPPQAGLRHVAEPWRLVQTEVLAEWLQGRAGGPAADGWMLGHYVQEGATDVCRIGPAWWFPQYGALIDEQGRVPVAPVGEARHNWPALDPLRGVRQSDGRLSFVPPRLTPRLPAATVAIPWGSANYGHFVMDGLTSVLAAVEAGLLDALPLVTPPLNRWQSEIMALAFGEIAPRPVAAPVVHLDGAIFSTAMDHFLAMPGPLTLRLRERVRARSPAATRRDRKLYVSRRSHHMRIMVDEPALERALAGRGFQIVRPERLAVADQLRLFKEAAVVVGPSGAGLTNALFADEGAKVVEIQPQNFASLWTPSFCRAAGLDWSGYICPSPGPSADAPWLSRQRRGFRFAYRLDVDDFLAFLDQRL